MLEPLNQFPKMWWKSGT